MPKEHEKGIARPAEACELGRRADSSRKRQSDGRNRQPAANRIEGASDATHACGPLWTRSRNSSRRLTTI